MADPTGPCCAHIHVEHKTEDYTYDGPDVPNPDPASPYVGLRHGMTLTRNWWECRDCKTLFAPYFPAINTGTPRRYRPMTDPKAETPRPRHESDHWCSPEFGPECPTCRPPAASPVLPEIPPTPATEPLCCPFCGAKMSVSGSVGEAPSRRAVHHPLGDCILTSARPQYVGNLAQWNRRVSASPPTADASIYEEVARAYQTGFLDSEQFGKSIGAELLGYERLRAIAESKAHYYAKSRSAAPQTAMQASAPSSVPETAPEPRPCEFCGATEPKPASDSGLMLDAIRASLALKKRGQTFDELIASGPEFASPSPTPPHLPTPDPLRDWTEDFSHENGNYFNTCRTCGNSFLGHKRRMFCKACRRPTPPSETSQ